MENLKIRVENEAESKEAQELFFELGYEKGACSVGCYPAVIVAMPLGRYKTTPYSSRATSMDNEAHRYFKEITLAELRALVSLHKNPINMDNVLSEVRSDTLGLLKDEPVKEYLNKLTDGTYKLVVLSDVIDGHDGLIEIPEGAQVYAVNNGYHYFFSSAGIGFEWSVLWQRPSLPEELPFIDDEPKRKRISVTISKPLLNDQYAEIEKVRQTLNQRQEQYGSFEDVAMITEQMVDVMRRGYYENLAYNQKMALYMICSKMARIVNGNPNHKDSWHDIAGYATLIDNELVSEKDMPF